MYNRTKIRGPKLVKTQVFPTHFGGGLFQRNLLSCECYRFA